MATFQRWMQIETFYTKGFSCPGKHEFLHLSSRRFSSDLSFGSSFLLGEQNQGGEGKNSLAYSHACHPSSRDCITFSISHCERSRPSGRLWQSDYFQNLIRLPRSFHSPAWNHRTVSQGWGGKKNKISNISTNGAIIVWTGISFFGSSWIPASAGMASKNDAFLMFVTSAKPGVQFEVLKRKRIPVNDVGTIMDPFVRQISSIKY